MSNRLCLKGKKLLLKRDGRRDWNMKTINLTNEQLPWLQARTILLVTAGSYSYGTNTETSDRDYKGVCIPPIDYYFGLHSFHEYRQSTGKNFQASAGDVEVTIMHITKFVNQAMQGIPNNIEMLFVRPEDRLKVTPLGQMLIDHRHLFLSKRVFKRFGGYARSQIQKLKTKRQNKTGRQDLVEKYGYDTKFFMHSIRLLTSAIEILETGDFQTYRPNRQLLLDCRNGKYSFEEALEMAEMYDEQLRQAYERSPLPSKVDFKKINQLLISIHQQAFVQELT